ncbi:hypothetical protein MYSTI_05654 [Myxococcus stipitatus DSM 14675]|uniref:Uncharacterized protein n=1 Tax=Myxococcus stipitatus (strain DSM 14675 / JCM 12634 / Mx s8) TaxID=1278073 RepID=L7UDF8_MYXSD|nr:hypothetical protein [Myxococcus stipitatus]AGC46931.1 hypothetical protein MYSTI_05654 [Myxococcus stipitatus DSM 14675]
MTGTWDDLVRVSRQELVIAATKKLGRALTDVEVRAIYRLTSPMLMEAWLRSMDSPNTTPEFMESELADLVNQME